MGWEAVAEVWRRLGVDSDEHGGAGCTAGPLLCLGAPTAAGPEAAGSAHHGPVTRRHPSDALTCNPAPTTSPAWLTATSRVGNLAMGNQGLSHAPAK